MRKYDKNGNCIKEYAVPNAENDRRIYIDAFCQTRNGDIYIACSKASLYKYNKKTDEFRPLMPDEEGNKLTGIFQDVKDDFLWITTKYGGILRFFPAESRYDTALKVSGYNEEPSYPIGNEIYSMVQDSVALRLWVAKRSGIDVYDHSESGLLTQYRSVDDSEDGIYHNIVVGSHGKIWLPSSYGVPSLGVAGALNSFAHNPINILCSRIGKEVAIKNMCVDSDRRYVWLIQPRLGLVLYDTQSNKVSVQSDFSNISDLRLHEAKVLAYSSSGRGVWVGRNGQRKAYLIKKGEGLSMKEAMTVDFSGIIDPMVNVTYLLGCSV